MAHKIIICICLWVASEVVLSQLPNTTSCPYEWAGFENLCFIFKKRSVSWVNAVHGCRKNGSVLAVVDTQKKLDFLAEMMRIMSWNGVVFEFWFGLTDEVRDDQWRWVKTGHVADKTFWDMATNHSAKHCAYIGFRNHQARWFKLDCTSVRYYLCEREFNRFLQDFWTGYMKVGDPHSSTESGLS